LRIDSGSKRLVLAARIADIGRRTP